MLVRDVMTEDVRTVGPDEDARVAYQKFIELGAHHVPVVEDGVAIGIISSSDFRGMIHHHGASTSADVVFGGRQVRSVMTPNPVSLPPDASIETAASTMLDKEFHALLVVEDDKLLGIITSHDLLSFLAGRKFPAAVKTGAGKG